MEWRRLDVPGVAELLGSGVYYGASPAEGARCRGEDIAIVGGGNSAGQAAIYFARHANRVTVLVRDASLDTHMSRYLVDRIAETDNIEVKAGLEIVEVVGDDWVRAVRLRDRATAEVKEFPLDALFVCIGGLPRSDWVAELGVARDRGGFILTGMTSGLMSSRTLTGRSPASRSRWRRTSRDCSPPATCATARSNACQRLSRKTRT